MDISVTRALTALRSLVTRALKVTDAKATLAIQHIPRCTQVDIGGLVNGAANAATVTASWTVPIAGDYRIVMSPVVAAARVGTIFAGVVPGTKTVTSVDITVVNLGPSTLAAGAVDVIVHPD